MILNDRQIFALAMTDGMIQPFTPELVRQLPDYNGRYETGLDAYNAPKIPCLSYGASSAGYDLRLSLKDFRLFRHIPGTVINPKAFSPDNLVQAELHTDEYGQFFILPGHSYGLGVAVEKLKIPNDITCLFIGKSTYCRSGVICNFSPGESGWEGYLTIEVSNSSPADVRVYANEGICQVLFFESEECAVSYGDRSGKYQNQAQEVTLAKA